MAVRYVVQERGPNSTRLFIDAVYIENARHHGHPSDGYVETCEFGEIGKLLKDREQLQKLAASGQPLSPGQESTSLSQERQEEIKAEAEKTRPSDNAKPKISKPKSSKSKDTTPPEPTQVAEVDSAKLGDLQRAIAEQKLALAADHAALDRLRHRRVKSSSEFVRVKSDRAGSESARACSGSRRSRRDGKSPCSRRVLVSSAFETDRKVGSPTS